MRRAPSTWPSWLLVSIWSHLAAGALFALSPRPPGNVQRPVTLLSPPDRAIAPADRPGRAPIVAEPGEIREARSAPPRDLLPPEPTPDVLPAPDLDWIPYVRTDPRDRAVRPPDDPVAISARDEIAPENRGTLVTADEPGPRTHATSGRGEATGSPTPDLRVAPPRDPRAGVPTGDARHGSDGGGGGKAGDSVGAGSAGQAGDRRAGGETAPGGTGPPGASPPQAPGGAGLPSDTPDWWHPIAARILVAPAAHDGDGADPAPTRGAGRALALAPGDATDRGGTDASADETAPPGRIEQSNASVLLRDDPGAMDPVDALREALGWGPLDRSDLGPRPAWADSIGRNGALATSPQLDAADLPVAFEPALSVEGTPLGRYIERLEDLVAERWSEVDLTVAERAAGWSGRVTVRYRVWPDGRITDRQLASSSGNLVLDTLALEAVPEHAPRFPRELERDEPLWHQVELNYRNPFVAVGR